MVLPFHPETAGRICYGYIDYDLYIKMVTESVIVDQGVQ